MPEFTAITTQEEFDARIKDRLERERTTVRKEFADYESVKNSLAAKTKEVEELNGKISGFDSQIKELKTKLSASESASVKTRVAYEMGLPFELCGRLTGTSEDELKKDAEALIKLMKLNQPNQPLYKPGQEGTDRTESAFKELLGGLKK